MSRKNHKMIDGRLLQTNKKYSQLKMKQKEKIAEWMFQATRDYYMKKCTFPSDKHLEEVVDSVYEKIEDAEIWIPYGEVFKHYSEEYRNTAVCILLFRSPKSSSNWDVATNGIF